MSEQDQWLSVPEFAEALGATASAIRDHLRARTLIAVRRGESQAWYLPADFIQEADGEVRVVPTLAGTITVLADAGFSDEEIVEWLLTVHEDLGVTPLAALREGRRAPVRRAAQTEL